MAFTKYTIVADGSESNRFPVAFSIPYYDKDLVTVQVNDVSRAFIWVTAAIIEISGAKVVDGDKVTFSNTPDITEPVHDFKKRAIISADALDANQLQARTAIGMALDGRFTSAFENDIDMGGHRIKNLSAPNAAKDAVNKEYVDLIDPGASDYKTAKQSAAAAKASEDAARASAVQARNSELVAIDNKNKTAADAAATAADRSAVLAATAGAAWVAIVTISDDKTLVANDNRSYFLVDTSAKDVSITLPPITHDGMMVGVQNLGANRVVVKSSDKINGKSGNYVVNTETESIQLLSDDASSDNWVLLSVSQTMVGDGLIKDGAKIKARPHNLIWFNLSDDGYPTLVKADIVEFSPGVNMYITSVVISLTRPQTTGKVVTFDVKVNGGSMFSTPITIDNGELSSVTASAASVISLPTFKASDHISVDCTQTGGFTACGASITFIGYPT